MPLVSEASIRRPTNGPLKPTALALALLMPLLALAQQHIVPPNPEQQGLPLNWRLEPLPQRAPQEPPAATGPAIADQVLPSPIRQIDCSAPRFSDEIQALLQPFIGQSSVSGQALEQVRGQIWSRYRQHGSLARVEVALQGRSADQGGSVLQVRVREVHVREVKVQMEGLGVVDPAVLDDILAGTKAELAAGGVFDVDLLDARIKRRVFLGDVTLHAILVPVGDDAIDVQVQVSAMPAAAPQWVLQYDNYGTQTYGRNRLTAAAAVPTVLTPGDRLNLLATAARRMTYYRLAYELPVVSWGVRAGAWASQVNYRAGSGEVGKVSQYGLDLTAPLYFGDAAVWTGYLDVVDSVQHDNFNRFLGGMTITDKRVDSVQARLDGNLLLGPTQTAHLSLAVMRGWLDLASIPSVRAQDALSARSDGGFTKLTWDAAWNGTTGPASQYDARVETKGQIANKNLDQSQKFTLGGPDGVRAYGGSEALGDHGVLGNFELGYRPVPTLRLYGFYDLGHVRLSHAPWVAGPTPAGYWLRGAGVGAAYSYRTFAGTLVYARQLGGNPGLAPNGRDSDGLRDTHRLWLTLSDQF